MRFGVPKRRPASAAEPVDACEVRPALGEIRPNSPNSPKVNSAKKVAFEAAVAVAVSEPLPSANEEPAVQELVQVPPSPSDSIMQAPPKATVAPKTPTFAGRPELEPEPDLWKFTQKEKASCAMYSVNLQSASFGECQCGLPKTSHSDDALKQNAEKRNSTGGTGLTTRRDEKELRSKFVQREYVECANYEVDMGPGVQYGMCRCGTPRAEHSNTALQGGKREFKAKRSNQDVIAQMKARAAATEAAATEATATGVAVTTHDPPTREDEAEAKVAKRDAHQSPAGVTHAAAVEEEEAIEAPLPASSPMICEPEAAQAESMAEALSPQPTAVAEEQACVRKSLTPMRDIEGVGSFLYTVLEQFVSPSKGVEKRSRCGCI